MPVARRNVCWVGTPPPSMEVLLQQRGLTLDVIGRKDVQGKCEGGARAVVIQEDNADDLSKVLSHSFTTIRNHDALLVVLHTDPGRDARLAGVLENLRRVHELGRGDQGIQFWPLHQRELWELANACDRHKAGRALGFAHQSLPGELDEEDSVLIRRAFNDFDAIQVDAEQLRRGRPAVLKVQAKRQSVGHAPFIIKIGPRGQIASEIAAQQEYCLDLVPFPNRPPLVPDRCVTGSSKQALVTMFVDDAKRLDDYVRRSPARNEIRRLFEGPLRFWRRATLKETVQPGKVYQEIGRLPRRSEMLEEAHRKASTVRDCWPPERLLQACLDLPAMAMQYCFAHGDLHLRNIFVRDIGDLVIIDFARANIGPAALDPAILDVSLALDATEFSPGLSDAEIERIFTPPLFGLDRKPTKNNRTGAIAQVRVEAAKLSSEKEYQIGVASLLLWHASRRENALAYLCANKIVGAL